jgi:hypothetical protein
MIKFMAKMAQRGSSDEGQSIIRKRISTARKKAERDKAEDVIRDKNRRQTDYATGCSTLSGT